MSNRSGARPHSQLARAGLSRIVVPIPTDEAARRLDAALQDRPASTSTHPFRRDGDHPAYSGTVAGGRFWVARRGSFLNPLEHRLEGEFVSLGDSTEVHVASRPRPAASAGLIAVGGALVALSVVAGLLAWALGSVPFIGGPVVAVVVGAILSLWILCATVLLAARSLAHGSEERVAAFIASVLDAPDDAL